MNVRVVMFDDLFARSNARVRTIVAGTGSTVRQVLGQAGFEDGFVAIRNGQVVEDVEAPVADGDEIHVAPSPEDPIDVALLAIAVVSAVVSVAIAANQTGLLPDASSSDEPEERRFGFNRFSNDAFAGDVIPVVAGERQRYGGKVIARIPVESSDGSGDPKLRILIALGHGRLDGIGDQVADFDELEHDELGSTWLNDTPIDSFPGVRAWGRLGTAGQAVIPGFRDIETLVAVGSGGFELRNTDGFDRTSADPSAEAVTFTTPEPVEGFVLRVFCPDGVFRLTNDAQVEPTLVRYRVRHRVPGGTYGPWQTIEIRQDRQSPFFSSPRFDRLSPDDAGELRQIQVERITKEPTDATVRDRLVWDSVIQLDYGSNNYPGQALLALELVANEQLQSVPRVSTKVRGVHVRVWDGVSDPSSPVFVRQWSANPAWIALEILTNQTWGLGSIYDDSNVDFPSLIAWAQKCDEEVERPPEGSGIYRPRYRYDYVLGDHREGIEWLRSVCQVGRAIPVVAGDLWRFIYDGPQAEPVETFGDGSIPVGDDGVAQFTYRREYTLGGYNRPNQVVVQYENRFLDDDVSSITYPNDGEFWLEDEVARPLSVRLDGVTDPDQAAVQAIYLLNIRRFLSRSIRFTTTKPVVVVQPGDRFDVAMSLPGWGKASGRIIAGSTTNQVRLDRSVSLSSGTTYRLRVTHLDGTVEAREIASDGTVGRGSIMVLASPLGQVPAEGAEYSVGEPEIEHKPFLCTSVRYVRSEGQGYDVEIEGIEYNAGVYSDLAGPVDDPDYSTLPSPTTPPGPVRDLVVFERIDPNTGQHQAHLAWNQTIDDASITGTFKVYWRPIGVQTWAVVPNAVVSLRAAVVELYDLDRGYEFIVVAVSVAGAFLSPYDPRHPIATLVLGLSAPPPDPPDSVSIEQTSDNTYRLVWSEVDGAVAYVVMAGGLAGTGLPNDGAEDCFILARPDVTELGGLELTPGQACRFWIRSTGANGRMSFTANDVQEATPATPAGESIQLTEVVDLDADGSRTNCTWNGSFLELVNPNADGVYLSEEIDVGGVGTYEATFRLDTANDTRDITLRDYPHGVPSIEADQWGIRYDSPKRVGMLMPPYPDDELAYVCEFRYSSDAIAWTDWTSIDPFESVQASFRYWQFRVTFSRTRSPYRPGVRGLRFVFTG